VSHSIAKDIFTKGNSSENTRRIDCSYRCKNKIMKKLKTVL